MSEDFSDKPTIRDERRKPPPKAEEIAEFFPQLEIMEVLGHGGMGVVYKARQKGLDRLVALKILPPSAEPDPNFMERFSREARALASLQHPNIVTVHDSGQAGDVYFFIMEYMDGLNLRRMMDSGELTPERAMAIVPKICDALQYAHDEGIMHRDIKPENILMDTKGRVKIADFGLVKLLAGKETDYTLTAPQQVMGTMHYMAPEQIERPGAVDHRADIYALGVVIYEMLTGELPIGRFPLPSEKSPLDARLDEIVLHALEKEPSRRYQQANDIKTDVETLSNGAGGERGHSPPPPPPRSALDLEAETASRARSSHATSHPSAFAAHSNPTNPTNPTNPANPMNPMNPMHAMSPAMTRTHPTPMGPIRSTGVAYLLWLLGMLGLCGIHRMYAGRWITGILWLFTGGLLFIGQLIDLFLIPGIIKMANLESAFIAQHYQTLRPGPPPGGYGAAPGEPPASPLN